MNISGYRQVYTGNGVEILERAMTAIPIERIDDLDIYPLPTDYCHIRMLPERNMESSSERRERRRRFRRSLCANLIIELAAKEVCTTEGLLIVDNPQQAARFLGRHVSISSNDAGDADFFSWFEHLKKMRRYIGFVEMMEQPRRMDVVCPASIVLRSTFNDDVRPLFHQGEHWYFCNSQDESQGCVLEQMLTVGAHQIPRISFIKEINNHLFSFDGKALSVQHSAAMAGKHKLCAFEKLGARLVASLLIDPIPALHLNPICWIRVPALAELEATLDDIAPLPMQLPLPACAFFYSSEAIIPLLTPESLPVIDEPEVVKSILARVQQNIFLADLPPMPVFGEWLREKPHFLLAAVGKAEAVYE